MQGNHAEAGIMVHGTFNGLLELQLFLSGVEESRS